MQNHDTNVHTQNSNSNQAEHYEQVWFIVPKHIMNLDGLTLAYLKVYEIMYQFWHSNRDCFMLQSTLMERAGVKKSQSYEALKFFEEHNQLVRRNINGRRYLVQPERKIETDIKESEPKKPKPKPKKLSTPVRKSGLPESGRADFASPVERTHNITNEYNNNNNINNKKEIAPPKKKSTGLAAREIEGQNPHQIPLQMINDWLETRRANRKPVTATAWKRLTNELGKCKNPVEAFEIMVTQGWVSLNHEWIENIESQKGKGKNKKAWESTDWVKRV